MTPLCGTFKPHLDRHYAICTALGSFLVHKFYLVPNEEEDPSQLTATVCSSVYQYRPTNPADKAVAGDSQHTANSSNHSRDVVYTCYDTQTVTMLVAMQNCLSWHYTMRHRMILATAACYKELTIG